MTKYILHGGNTSDKSRDNDLFWTEFTKGMEGRVKILLNCFARDEDVVEERVKRDEKFILNFSENKNLEFQIAK